MASYESRFEPTLARPGMIKHTSNIYTPVFSSQTNLDFADPGESIGYVVNGKSVTIFGILRIDATSTGNFSFNMTYPPGLLPRTTNVPTAISTSIIAFGTATTRQGDGYIRISGDTSNVMFSGNTVTTGAEYYTFTAMYLID